MSQIQSLYNTTCTICEKITLSVLELGESFALFGDSINRGITASRLASFGDYEAAKKEMFDD